MTAGASRYNVVSMTTCKRQIPQFLDMSTSTVQTACNRDCPDACEIIATLTNGRITRLRGSSRHPITQGFLCHRTSRFLDRQYSPERLNKPLWRHRNDFRPISWNEALDRIAERMLRIREESGPAALMHYRCGGSMGIMKHVTDWFFHRFGPVTVKSGDICSGAGEYAQTTDFGKCDSNDFFDLRNSRTIVLWGKNVFVSSVHLIPLLREAKQAGCRLILIDPVRHQTAQICTQYLQPRAGTDAAIACGMARWIIDHGKLAANVADFCDHWVEYQELVHSKTVEEWARMADLAPDELTQLAKAYAEGPSAIIVGWGLQRRRFGATSVRAIDALGAVSGNMGISGGGVSYYFQRRGAFDFSFATNTKAPPRQIPEPLLGRGLINANDPPIRMVWITAANPVAMLPESSLVDKALRTRELTVVVDSFLTDTARAADVVLPTTTFLEESDLLGAYGHHWLADMQPVTKPPTGVLSDYEITQQLAQRLGLGTEFSDSVEIWKERLLQRVAAHGVSTETLKQAATRNPLSANVIFAGNKFATPSGKANLISKLPAGIFDAPPTLRLAAFSTNAAQCSQWQSHEQQGPATATVHPQVVPGANSGDLAEISSAVGVLTVILNLDETQRPDVVLMDKGGWHHKARSANALVPAETTDHGECAVYYDTPIIIRPIKPTPDSQSTV